MTLDSMRVGRCPLFIVVGLLVICVVLICNWLALTSENTEILKQIDDMSEQLKFSVDERDKCVTRLGDALQDHKRSKAEIGFLHVQLEQYNELKKRNEEQEESITICKTELDSLKQVDATKTDTLDSLRLEKDAIHIRLQAQEDENKKLKETISKMKEELDKLKATNVQPQKGPTKLIDLIMPPTNNTINEISDGLNTDEFNKKSDLMRDPIDQDNAAEQM